MKKIINIIYWLLMGALILVAGLSAMSVFGFPKNFRAFVVQSGSMEPTIKAGSIIFIRPVEEYGKDDIITFKPSVEADIKNPKATITHRIVNVKEEDGQTLYTTKGDANEDNDFSERNKDLVLGKVLYSVPYLGYPVGFAKTQTGFVLLIVIPATIIVYSEILNIKKELKRISEDKKKKKGKSKKDED